MSSLTENIRCHVKMGKMTMSVFGRSQYKDWIILMNITTAAVFLVAIFGLCLYINLNIMDSSDNTSQAVPSTKIDRTVLNTMLNKMGDKQKNFEILKSSKPIFKDPSVY